MLVQARLLALLDDVPQISSVAHQHQRATPACQALLRQHAQPQQHCGGNGHIRVKGKRLSKGYIHNQSGKRYNEQNVKDIATHNIANRNIGITLARSSNGGEELRQARAQRHNREADNALT